MTVAQPKPLSRCSNDFPMATRELLHAPSEPLGDPGQGSAHWPARQA
jgi:hypothetical protein